MQNRDQTGNPTTLERLRQEWALLLLLLVLLGAYGTTLAPGITWANGGTDSAELAAAVASAGIPHPPGYPTFMLVGIIWTRALPFLDVAYALNWLSALSVIGAALLLLMLTRRLALPAPAISGVWGGLLFATAPLVWSQAILVEVYALGVASFALCTWAAVQLLAAPTARKALLCGVLFGVGGGALPQIALGLPPLALALLWRGPRKGSLLLRYTLLGSGVALGVGLVFLYIPLRAAVHPYVNWGAVADWESFRWLVTAETYQHLAGVPSLAVGLERLWESLSILTEQVRVVGWLPIAWGGWHLWRTQRPVFIYSVGVLGLTLLFHTGYRVENNPVYLIPAIWLLGLSFGLGLVKFYDQLRQQHRLSLFSWLFTGIFMLNLWWGAEAVSIRADQTAITFSQETLAALPPDAVLFSRDEAVTFALWYQQATGKRLDVIVVDLRLIYFDWYQWHLPRLYPSLSVDRLWPTALADLQHPRFEVQGAFPSFRLVQLG